MLLRGRAGEVILSVTHICALTSLEAQVNTDAYQVAVEVEDSEGPAAIIVLTRESDGTVLDKHQADRVDSDSLAAALLLSAYACCTHHSTRVKILRLAELVQRECEGRTVPINNDFPF